jgi:hypothetical protein
LTTDFTDTTDGKALLFIREIRGIRGHLSLVAADRAMLSASLGESHSAFALRTGKLAQSIGVTHQVHAGNRRQTSKPVFFVLFVPFCGKYPLLD